VINSFDYGVPQNRIRIYIIGFKEKGYFESFILPKCIDKKLKLGDILGIETKNSNEKYYMVSLNGIPHQSSDYHYQPCPKGNSILCPAMAGRTLSFLSTHIAVPEV